MGSVSLDSSKCLRMRHETFGCFGSTYFRWVKTRAAWASPPSIAERLSGISNSSAHAHFHCPRSADNDSSAVQDINTESGVTGRNAHAGNVIGNVAGNSILDPRFV